MTDEFILSSIPIDKLINLITEKVMAAIKEQQQEDQQEKFLTTKDVCKVFNITPVTVNAWIKRGNLKKYTKGRKNFFKYQEIMDSMKNLKKYKV